MKKKFAKSLAAVVGGICAIVCSASAWAEDHALDYIQGSGESYASLPIAASSLTGAAVFELDVTIPQTDVASQLLYGLDKDGNRYNFGSTANRGLFFGYGKGTVSAYRPVTAGSRHTIAVTNGTAFVDGTLLVGYPYEEFALASSQLMVFGTHTMRNGVVNDIACTSRAVIHSLKIWTRAGADDALTPVYDLTPYEKDGRPGFLNAVDGAFYPSTATSSVGASDFNAGQYVWQPSEGVWSDSANWLKDAATQEDRVPGTRYAGDSAIVDASTTIRFPAEDTAFNGKLLLNKPSPAAGPEAARTITLDSRGTSFRYHAAFQTQPFVRGWS